MTDKRIRKLLKQFLSGRETEQGRKLVERWYHSFDDRKNPLDEVSQEEKEEIGEHMYARIQSSIESSKAKNRPAIFGFSGWTGSPFIRMAAVCILVLFVAIPALYMTGNLPVSGKEETTVVYMESANAAGETSRVTLADGTTVWLGAESTLRYPRKFADSLREVYLTGEAFFDVAHNEDKPFAVHSGILTTRVLGTSFNIKAYRQDKNIEVTVATGRVSVEKSDTVSGSPLHRRHPLALLTPNRQIVYEKATGRSQVKPVNTRLITGWKDGRLVFEKESFEDIARVFERWYGVQVRFEDEQLKQQRFTFSFKDMPLVYALDMMKNTSDFIYEMQGDTVSVRGVVD